MSTEGPSPSYHFEVVNSSGDTHLYEISEPLCSLGTSEDEADILIDDPSLSPVHLILSFDGFRVRCRPVGGDIRIGSTVMPALTPFLLQNELRLDFGYSSLTLKQVVSGEDEVENLKTPPRGIRVDEVAALLGDPVAAEEPPLRASPPPPPVRSNPIPEPDADPVPEIEPESTPEPNEKEWADFGQEPTAELPPAVQVAPRTATPVAAVVHSPPTTVVAVPVSDPTPASTPAPDEDVPPPTVALTPPPPAPETPRSTPAPAIALPAAPAEVPPPRRVDAPTAAGAVQVSTGAVPWDYELAGVLFATAATTIGDDFDATAPGSPFHRTEADLRRQAFALGCHGVAFTRFEQRITPGSGAFAARPVLEVFAYGTAVRRLG